MLPGEGASLHENDAGLLAIESFLRDEVPPDVPDTVLATVLFTDLVGSTQLAAELGDRRWREVLEAHHAAVRRELSRFGGVELDTAGDGFFASFDGPARAIACARAIVAAMPALGLADPRRHPHRRVRARGREAGGAGGQRRRARRSGGRRRARCSSPGRCAISSPAPASPSTISASTS